MANFCCPIETEPRTLNIGQLIQAREIAVDIVKIKELDEATAMFHEDLKSAERMEERAIFDPSPPLKAAADGRESVIKNCCQCSCTSVLVDDSPEPCRIKEPVSASF